MLSEISFTSSLSPLLSGLSLSLLPPATVLPSFDSTVSTFSSDGCPGLEGSFGCRVQELIWPRLPQLFSEPTKSPCTQLALNWVKPLPVSAAVLRLACSHFQCTPVSYSGALLVSGLSDALLSPPDSFLSYSTNIMQVWWLLAVYLHHLLIFCDLWIT